MHEGEIARQAEGHPAEGYEKNEKAWMLLINLSDPNYIALGHLHVDIVSLGFGVSQIWVHSSLVQVSSLL